MESLTTRYFSRLYLSTYWMPGKENISEQRQKKTIPLLVNKMLLYVRKLLIYIFYRNNRELFGNFLNRVAWVSEKKKFGARMNG